MRGGTRPAVGRGAERHRHAFRGERERQAGGGIDVRAHPDRVEPGEDEAGEHRLVKVPGNEDEVARPAEREGERLVPLRRAVHAEAAAVGAPEGGGEALSAAEHVGAQVEVVGARRQREVMGQEAVGEMRGPLVPRRREGRDARLGEECGGRVRERGLALVHEARFYPIRGLSGTSQRPPGRRAAARERADAAGRGRARAPCRSRAG
jgi:hypothetical protein